MMDDNFDFDQFMEENGNEFNSKLEEWKEKMIVEAIESNYAQIEKNGISVWHLRSMDNDQLKDLSKTLQMMLDHYQDLEEYEKCQVVFDHLKSVEEVLV